MDPIKMFEDVLASTEMKKYFAKLSIESQLKNTEKATKESYRGFLDGLDAQVTFTVEEKVAAIRKISEAYSRAADEVIRELKAEAYDEQQAEEDK